MSPLLLVPGPVKGAALAAKKRLLGLGLVVVILGLLAVTILVYLKVFTPVDMVTLRADRAGNQLSEFGDVKYRGLRVGEIRTITSTGDGAVIEMAIDPELIGQVPADVQARLLPKTLFGEKFVSLTPPPRSSSEPLQAGDTIGQDRSSTAIETEAVFDDLLPLLEAVQPAKLNSALAAVATALNGNGDTLGQNLQLVNSYLVGLSPSYPDLGRNFALLDDVTNLYADAAPDLLTFLDNISATNRTIAAKADGIEAAFTSTTRFSASFDTLLAENEARLISVPRNNLPFLELAARYSPVFPCLAQGFVRQEEGVNKTLGQNPGTDFKGLHITLELTNQRSGYEQDDAPLYLDDTGPDCLGLPDNPPMPAPYVDFRDGFEDGEGGQRPEEANAANPRPMSSALSTGGVGSEREQAVIGAVVAPVMERSFEDVPDVATLLVGPLARGTSIGLDVDAGATSAAARGADEGVGR